MTTATQTFDDVDKALLTQVQQQFPVDHRPFQVLGEKLGITEQQCLERIGRLKQNQVIRQLSAIFDTRALGYQSTLAAMKVDAARVDDAAAVVNQHPGVSHNYKRNDPFNIWFTVAVPPTDSLEQVVKILHMLAKADEGDAVLNDRDIPIHGDGLQTRSFTYVSDTIEGIYASIVKPEANGEIFNIGSTQEISIIDLAKLIRRLCGSNGEARLKFVPYESFAGGKYEDVRRRVPDVSRCERILGVKATVGLEDGLRRTIEWQRNISKPLSL